MTQEGLLIGRTGPFAVLPVIHHRYEFALAASEAFRLLLPCAVALEYPKSFQTLILQGVVRLPRISILLFGRNFIRIEPVDPFVEAARMALENDMEFRCVDLAVPDYPEMNDPVPDTYSMMALGHRKYCEMLLESFPRDRSEEDERRECAMAFHLQEFADHLDHAGKLESERPILMLCGLSHFHGLLEMLGQKQAQPFQPAVAGKLYHLSSQSLGEIMGVFPFLTAIYEMKRGTAPLPEPGPSSLDSTGISEASPGLHLMPEKKKETLSQFVKRAQATTALDARQDHNDILTHFLFWCREYYESEIGDRIHPQSLKMLHQFSRKYANVKNMLLPDFYELLVAARGCVGSHFCYRMWEIGTTYTPQQGPAELEIIELRASDIFPLVQKVRMNPNAPLRPRSPLPRFLRRNEKQKNLKEKDFRFHPFSICSYQPEDIIIEDYGRYLKSKGKSMLSEDRKRVRPFETSLLDGIDLRETIRNWHSGTIYVQEFMTVKGSVDSMIVIYDEDDRKYPYTMTWMGEHYQESDMAFYATDPEERQIGPGIRRATYGGFLMTMPPGRLFDVFHDPAYHFAENHAERLLLAGIDYGLERFVLYAAPKPPRPLFQVIAGRYGKRILYIPLAQLSPVQLQRVRAFHVLADKSVRDYAKDYIW